LQEKKTQWTADKQTLLKDMSYMEFWGDFSYANIERLREAGYVVTFFSCPNSRFDPKWREEYNAFPVNNVQSVTYFITVTPEGAPIDIDAERPKMPDCGAEELRLRYRQLLDNLAALDKQTDELAAEEYHTLEAFGKQLQNDFNLANIIAQTGRKAADRLMFLEGWTTEDQVAHLEQELDKQGYFYQPSAIEANEKIPIKLKNNRYSRLFEPITKIFSLPNYAEIDPTPLLAPFFMLFFGLCFGDGGYGLLILLACLFLKQKPGLKDFKPFLSLFQWLGGMTIVIGTLTGSFFGLSLANIEAFKGVREYFISSDNLMMISIVIGVIHILFGKIVAAYKIKIQRGAKYCIAPFAWVFVIASLGAVFGLPMLHVQLPGVVVNLCYSIAGGGLLFALLGNMPGRNVFLNLGAGLWNAYNIASGLLGDTLSYIRLFAIGLTGSILGGVFNTLSSSMTESLPLVARIICMLLILAVGHGINFGLCMISSLVHPLRLIFVEYYKNSEFEGGGIEYVPFKKI
jgi:V/A-type H+-transporting ATPase subunit I